VRSGFLLAWPGGYRTGLLPPPPPSGRDAADLVREPGRRDPERDICRLAKSMAGMAPSGGNRPAISGTWPEAATGWLESGVEPGPSWRVDGSGSGRRVLLASANAGKQSGFYTDFDSDSGSWTSPADVSQVSFDQIRPLIGDYIAETQRQLDEFMSFRNTAPSASAQRQAEVWRRRTGCRHLVQSGRLSQPGPGNSVLPRRKTKEGT
jgi:hypothetical protein